MPVAAMQNAEFSWQHCDRVGATAIERLSTMYEIATRYDDARDEDCRTAALVPRLDSAQTASWWDYLINYTIALSGCPLVVAPLRGGISVFGPANTASIGLAHPPLGRDDVALLVEMYLAPFAAAFALPKTEQEAMQAYLWSSAEPEIDAAVSGGLSACTGSTGR